METTMNEYSLFQHTINGKTSLQAGVCVGFFGPEWRNTSYGFQYSLAANCIWYTEH
jgi:hypothetical protein